MEKYSITPNESIITVCSVMLEELYAISDYTTREDGNSLIDDDRSQFIGYLSEIIDVALYEMYGVKTSFYDVCESTGHFSKFRSTRILDDYIQFSGYIDTSDTDCNPEIGKTRVHNFTNMIYEIETVRIEGTQWQVSFKIPLEKLSEFMYQLEQE
mgnify:CR=1 FL=1